MGYLLPSEYVAYGLTADTQDSWVTSASAMMEAYCKRPTLMRLVPFSYFCTCWNVIPSASPSFVWLIPSIFRRIRTRLPTCLSTGLAAFLSIARFTMPPND